MMNISLKYVGMIPTATKGHPFSTGFEVLGRWYSLPVAGFCASGANVGDNGCTWRIAPISYTISLGTAYNIGVFKPPGVVKYTGGQGNPKVAAQHFAGLGAGPCGASAPPPGDVLI